MRISDWISDVCSSDLPSAPPLLAALAELVEPGPADRAVQRAAVDGFTGNAVLLDQIEHQAGCAAEQFQQRFAARLAQGLDKLVGPDPHAGVYQADVASGTAAPDPRGPPPDPPDPGPPPRPGRP